MYTKIKKLKIIEVGSLRYAINKKIFFRQMRAETPIKRRITATIDERSTFLLILHKRFGQN